MIAVVAPPSGPPPVHRAVVIIELEGTWGIGSVIEFVPPPPSLFGVPPPPPQPHVQPMGPPQILASAAKPKSILRNLRAGIGLGEIPEEEFDEEDV